MVNISIVVIKDTASPALAALDDALKPENMVPVFAQSVSNSVQRNFDSDEELKAADVFLHQLAICANAARLDIAKAVAK